MIIYIFSMVIAGALGFIANMILMKKIEKDLKVSFEKENSDIFKEVIKCILNKKSVFKTRFMNNVHLKVNLKNHGIIDLNYYMDSGEILLFKDSKLKYQSKNISANLLSETINAITTIYKSEINDIAYIFGIIVYRKDFERMVNMELSQFNKAISKVFDKENNLDNFYIKKEKDFDLDEILDKINKYGISSLNIEEKKYLDSFNKNK